MKNEKCKNNIPKIIASIVETNDTSIIKSIQEMNGNYDMIELRLDYYEYLDDDSKLISLLQNINRIIKDKQLLVTIRTHNEGGVVMITPKQYRHIYKLIIPYVSLIDIEYSSFDIMQPLIPLIQHHGVKIIGSIHDYTSFFSYKKIVYMVQKIDKLPVDIIKIAIMPTCMKDIDILFQVGKEIVLYTKKPIAFMAMGKLGMVTRIAGELMNTSFVFGKTKNEAAPGQIPIEDLNYLLNIIHQL